MQWTSASFRLVSNGCSAAEQRFLAKLSQQDHRLEFWSIPTRSTLSHGLALNYLQAMSREDYFCFMDSDIFATGDFVSEIMPSLTEYSGAFSGMPLWVKQEEEVFPDNFKAMTGMFKHTENGLVLGSTFFAIYNNPELTDIMQSTGVGFEEYHWDQLSPFVQQRLKALGLEVDVFDTGKALNLLLQSNNKNLVNLNLEGLCHIGGTSFQVAYNSHPLTWKRKLIKKLPGVAQTIIQLLIERRALGVYKKKYANSPKAEFNLNTNQRIMRRNPVRQYFLGLLTALHQDTTIPAELVTGDNETDTKIKLAREQLQILFQTHRHRLNSEHDTTTPTSTA
ncbi:MAG: glycosyltransferase family 2 protein [Gammaproteobacteria bacterium]|nr:glycosyltransferase family 2 protein [Gammaproteobacteria bacterium]